MTAPSLAAVRDHRLDPRIPEHREELIRRGMLGDPRLLAEARKFKPRAMTLGDWRRQ